MKIAAAVILYHPDERITQRILTYANAVERLFVFDNTEDNTGSTKALRDILALKQVCYIHDGENKGIAIRLNQAAAESISQNMDWLLTMDQDSYFPGDNLRAYFNCIRSYGGKDKVAMFGAQFMSENVSAADCRPEEVDHLITSGSVVNLNLYQQIGGFDEALFIDNVDLEYCLRAKLLNFGSVAFQNIFFHHTLGKKVPVRSFFNLKITHRVLHPPLRMYYILRNYFYLKRKFHRHFKEEMKEMKKGLLNRTKNNLLYGGQRIQLIQYLVKGYLDSKAGKMGKVKQKDES